MTDEPHPMTGRPEPMAVTVIGGYLGAGKTTLVNHILRTADERVAVLVNDFGDIDIDAELIEGADGDTISLANGCICCSLVDGLAAALDTVKNLEPRPERLVIEASGVADPATIAAYGHSPGLRLDAVVVVADAETVRARSRDRYVGDTVLGQLRSADILVLNKVDLIPDGDREAIVSWLSQQATEAVIVETSRSQVSPTLLFGLERPADPVPVRAEDHHHVDDLFQSWSWSSAEPLTRELVERLMDELPDQVVRAKGVVRLADEPDRRMVLQRVGRRWTLRPGGPWSGEPGTRIVVIGMVDSIDDRWLSERLQR